MSDDDIDDFDDDDDGLADIDVILDKQALKNKAKANEEKQRKIKERIELRKIAAELGLSLDDYIEAFGDEL